MKKLNATRKKSFVVQFGVFAFAVYVIVSLLSIQMEINSKRTELDAINAKIESQRLANKEVERQLNLGDDEAYLARIARDKLGMGLPDEHVYRDAAGS